MRLMPTLTVFTPTYNRAALLRRGYEALCQQTLKDFVWLIIDDGSIDNTKELVEQWKQVDNGFVIQYVYKENGGLHTGYNKAIELMETEICVCVDSDDWMPDDAVDTIVNRWRVYKKKNLSGMVGLDYLSDGTPLGIPLPEGTITHYIGLKENKRFNFDNKVVMRVDLLKQVAPQPSFNQEKNFNPIWLILKIDEIAPFVLINKNLCYVEYQDGGMSNNLVKQYFNSPNSFLELRKLYISLRYASLSFKLKNHVHLIAQSFIAKKNPFSQSPSKILTALFFPLGCLLYLYMRYTYFKTK